MTESEGSGQPLANTREYSVSELSRALKRTVEDAFPFVRVRGELGPVKRHTSGHIYLDLKDEGAVIAGVIWKGTAARLAVAPEQGLEVIATGRITTFPGQSKYQLVIERLELAGLGALMKLLDERKRKLAAEGLFDAARKKSLPFLPEVIGVITSPTGAVIRDILHRLADRFPRRVLLWPVAVQGERAAGEVAAAIRGFNALREGGAVPRPDLIIVARGGGSFEDLMAFNEEGVVRAAAASAIPLIAAVGHETDTTLIDFAADMRAPTPTAAAELAVPVRAELKAQTLGLEQRLLRGMHRALDQRRTRLQDLTRALPRREDLMASQAQRLDLASTRLAAGLFRLVQRQQTRLAETGAKMTPRLISEAMRRGADRLTDLSRRQVLATRRRLENAERALTAAARLAETLSYRATLTRGFAVVRGADGQLRRLAAQIHAGEPLRITFADGDAPATAASEGEAMPQPQRRPKTAPPRKGGQGTLF
ncbi:MAG: exodeoxyribonuclease VII large subunit [Alphaproteobacteria bacterium]|nr:exodeoxyribonuclease VII large subunit [Alphaproteobacteria bacterium]